MLILQVLRGMSTRLSQISIVGDGGGGDGGRGVANAIFVAVKRRESEQIEPKPQAVEQRVACAVDINTREQP